MNNITLFILVQIFLFLLFQLFHPTRREASKQIKDDYDSDDSEDDEANLGMSKISFFKI